MTALTLALQGDLQASIRRETAIIRKASVQAVREETREVQLRAREVINQRFTGSGRVGGGNRRVANAVRSKVYDNGSGSVAGLIYSKFGRRGAGGEFLDYLLPFVEGAVLRPRKAKFLYIPVEKRGKRGPKARLRETVAGNEKLAFVPSADNRRIYIVRRTRNRSVLVAVLVRQVRIEARLDFAAVIARAEREFPGRLVAIADRLDTAA